jgi:hypothetical protein
MADCSDAAKPWNSYGRPVESQQERPMTSTGKYPDRKIRLTQGIAVLAFSATLGGMTYGFSTSPGITGSRTGDGNSPIRSVRIAEVRNPSNGESHLDDYQNDIVVMRKAGKPQQEYF